MASSPLVERKVGSGAQVKSTLERALLHGGQTAPLFWCNPGTGLAILSALFSALDTS